jgi:hypothetical protein
VGDYGPPRFALRQALNQFHFETPRRTEQDRMALCLETFVRASLALGTLGGNYGSVKYRRVSTAAAELGVNLPPVVSPSA